MPWMDRHDGMMNWWMGGWGWVVLLVALIAVVALVTWLVARSAGGADQARGHSRTDALHLLEERFARGEIDREEFEARRAALRDDDT